MEIKIEDQINVGDGIFGIRIYNVEAQYLQKHISIAIFPIRFGIMYVNQAKRLKLNIVLFNKLTFFIGLGVSNG